MRKAKLYQLLAVVGGLSVAVATTPAWAKPGNGGGNSGGDSGDSSLTAVPLNWTAGTATVDGSISEWDLSTDAATKMCEAGRVDSNGDCDGKVQLSTLYARYDCDNDTMYILVLKKEEDHSADGDRWVKIYDVGNSEYPITIADVVVGGESQGYEASFSLAAGTYSDVQIHINIDGGRTSSTGKNGTTRSITVPVSCEMPVVEDPVDEPTDPVDEPTDPVDEPTDPVDEPTDPVDEPTDPVDEPTDPVDEPTDPVDEPTDPVDEPTDPVDEPTDPVDEPTDPVDEPTDPVDEPTDPVDEPTSGGGNPNMACEDINGSNGVPMSLIAKYETNNSGEYVFEGSGTDIINITDANLSGGTWSVEGGVVKVGAIIVKGGTDTDVDQDGNDSFSNEGLVNGGGNTPDISNIQFCEVPVFDASEQVCLWSANKDADGNYINIVQEGCTDAEQGKFYAIEAGGEFSSALEAE